MSKYLHIHIHLKQTKSSNMWKTRLYNVWAHNGICAICLFFKNKISLQVELINRKRLSLILYIWMELLDYCFHLQSTMIITLMWVLSSLGNKLKKVRIKLDLLYNVDVTVLYTALQWWPIQLLSSIGTNTKYFCRTGG